MEPGPEAIQSESLMSPDPGLDLLTAEVDRVLPFRDSAAVVLRVESKPFMIFVGRYEAQALMRVRDGQRTERPLTHDVIAYILTGFDIEVNRVVISSIVNGVFCSTLVLKRDGPEPEEVRLDIRASDSLVIALKTGVPILVARRVVDDVEDVTGVLERIDAQFEAGGDPADLASDADEDEDEDEDEEDI